MSRGSQRLQFFHRRFPRSFHLGRTLIAAGTVQSVLVSRASPSSASRRVASVRTRVAACKTANLHHELACSSQKWTRFSGSLQVLVKQGHRIGRPIPFPNGQASTDGRCDEILGSSHAFSNCLLVGQIGRNGRSEDATGTVCVLGVDTLSAKLSEFAAVVEDVGGYVFQMTTLDDDVFWSKVANRPGGLFHLRKRFDFASRERPGFIQVTCDHGGYRHQFRLDNPAGLWPQLQV